MKTKQIVFIVLAMVAFLAFASAALAGLNAPPMAGEGELLYQTVRESTAQYHELNDALDAGYGQFLGCVSSPQEGAMGVHFANGDLVGDGELDATTPEVLLYEYKNGQMHLVAVEYVVLAEDWNSANNAPPVLMGQLFNYVGSPNRYGMPAFYELHVWSWKRNPSGVFADFNPKVSCRDFPDGFAVPSGHQ